MGLIVAGTVSTGGLAALAVKVSRKRNRAAEIELNSEERKNQNVDQKD
jgi:Holliday junction resolvase